MWFHIFTWSAPLHSGTGQGHFCRPFVLIKAGFSFRAGGGSGEGEEIFSSVLLFSEVEVVIGSDRGRVLSKSRRVVGWEESSAMISLSGEGSTSGVGWSRAGGGSDRISSGVSWEGSGFLWWWYVHSRSLSLRKVCYVLYDAVVDGAGKYRYIPVAVVEEELLPWNGVLNTCTYSVYSTLARRIHGMYCVHVYSCVKRYCYCYSLLRGIHCLCRHLTHGLFV